ncbi:unnamed protein product [Ascophyllum nodosum]
MSPQAQVRSASLGSFENRGISASCKLPGESVVPDTAVSPTPPGNLQKKESLSNSGEGGDCKSKGLGESACSIVSLEDAAQRIAADPISGQLFFVERTTVCDACPCCEDVCEVDWCNNCDDRRAQLEEAYGPLMVSLSELQGGSVGTLRGGERIRRISSRNRLIAPVLSRRYPRKSTYTLCEVRRRKITGACWVVCKGVVYDVTAALEDHPGGKRSILRNAGGRDCIEDFLFHSKAARKHWRRYKIGNLVACSGEDVESSDEIDGERFSRAASDCVIM